jgi:hypothetical protein
MGDEYDGKFTGNDLVCLLGLSDFFWCWDVLQELGHEQIEEVIEYGGWGVMVVRRFDGGMPSPTTDTTKDNMKIPAVRINHKNAHMPDPTDETIESLALKGWIDYSGGMQPLVGHEMPQWDNLPDEIKQVWLGVAKGQHVVMSLIGGATVEQIEDDDAD